MKSYNGENPLYPKPKENHAANVMTAIFAMIIAIIAIGFIISRFSFYVNPSSALSTPVTVSSDTSVSENEVYNNDPETETPAEESEKQTQPSFSIEKAEPDQNDISVQNIYSKAVNGDYMIPDSSTSYLTESDLYGMSREQLSVARNEIYARNGRLFQDQELQEYFNSKPWYHGSVEPEDFTLEMLNDYEYCNINLIASYEESLGYR